MRTRLVVITVLCFAILIAASLLVNWGGDEDEIITCGIGTGSTSYLPYAYGIETGIFRKYGLNVTYLEVKNSYTSSLMFVTGRVDLNTPSPGIAANTYAEGERFRIAMAVKKGSDFRLMTQPGITDVAELKGKRLGLIGRNSDAYRIMKWYLDSKGIDIENDLELIEIANPGAMATSFISGQLDAAVLWSGYAARAISEGMTPLLDCSQALEEIIGYPIYLSIIVVKDEVIEGMENNEVDRYLRAMREICREINENREDAAEIWARHTGDPVEDLIPVVEMMEMVGDLDEDAQEAILEYYRHGIEEGDFEDAPTEEGVFYTDWR
jgi:ABC-type nitrate/sulfonate/bicarbonate transport system substrate-binding protein